MSDDCSELLGRYLTDVATLMHLVHRFEELSKHAREPINDSASWVAAKRALLGECRGLPETALRLLNTEPVG